tara:strand:- start:391 stop:669 length:279 start_codon:yes stop_codon:yes gene_type:complete
MKSYYAIVHSKDLSRDTRDDMCEAVTNYDFIDAPHILLAADFPSNLHLFDIERIYRAEVTTRWPGLTFTLVYMGEEVHPIQFRTISYQDTKS